MDWHSACLHAPVAGEQRPEPLHWRNSAGGDHRRRQPLDDHPHGHRAQIKRRDPAGGRSLPSVTHRLTQII